MSRGSFLVILLLGLTQSALADEVWVCNFPAEEKSYHLTVTRYWLRARHLAEFAEPYRRYDILVDNSLAVVAASGYVVPRGVPGLPRGHYPEIGVNVFVIERSSGKALKTFTKLGSRSDTPERGICHLQTSLEPGAVWPPGFESDPTPAPGGN